MGQITSGVGIISGIDTASLIDQLLAIDARPKTLIQQRNAVLTSQQVAFQEINAKLLTAKLSADNLALTTTFNTTSAASSDTSVLDVSSGNSAVPGTYDFVVSRLVSTQQVITNGFADQDATAIAPSGGTLTFEAGDGKLTSDTQLSRLNGGNGISRGKIRITDRSGASEVIDLSTALSVDDVLEKINSASLVSVQASVDGDHFVISDTSGATSVDLAVSNVGSNGTATSLGLAGSIAGSTLTGSDINTISGSTRLDDINDGNGVRATDATNDFRITLRDGSTHDVNVGGLTTLEDVIDAINAVTGVNATASINDDNTGLKIVDNTAGVTTTEVTALNSSNAALDLGILTSDIDSDGTLDGDRVIANLNSKLLKNLRGGQGITQTFSLAPSVLTPTTLLSSFFSGAGTGSNGSPVSADLRIRPRDTTTITNVEVDDLSTVQDFIDRIDTTFGGDISVTIEGRNLRFTDNTGGGGNFLIVDSGSSTFATTLGIDLNAATNTVLSNDVEPSRLPTQGLGPGQIEVTNSAGTTTEIELTTARSVDDIITLINNAGAGISVDYNSAQNGLTITDTAGGGGDLIIADVGNTVAAELGIAGTFSSGVAESGNLQVQYISEATRLAAMHGGKGITRGEFTLTDSNGASANVDLTQGDEVTIGDVIQEINSRGLAITARINDTGDGILLEDTGTGVVALTVEESGSSTAADLGLLGAAANPGDDLDGSFETTITIDAADTLDDVVTKINDAGIDVKATIVNDGSAANPFRLSLLSSEEGKAGAFVFDDGGLGFGATTLVEAKNAAVFFGSTDAALGVPIISASNTLDSVVPGATINLTGTSTSSTRVVISRDNDSIADTASGFVDNLNAIITSLDTHDSYDAETEQRGLLLGDATVARVRSSIFNLLNSRNTDVTGQFTSFAEIGITVGTGAKVEFDRSKFLSALDSDRDAVINLFTLRETETDPDTNEVTILESGIGVDFSELLKGLTDSTTGALQSKLDSLDDQVELNNERIANIDKQLAAKRARLEAQFVAMEKALADLQQQSNALASFQPVAPVTSSGGNLF